MLTPNDEVIKRSDVKPLKAAQMDDDRHRLHAEAATSQTAASPYFRRWVTAFLNPVITAKAKRDQVLKQFAWPPVTVHLVDEIIDMTGAVHNGQDKYRNVALSDERLERDFTQYLKDQGVDTFFSRDCHNALYSGPNSFVVCDLPAVQNTPFPQPYVYLLASHKVRAAKAKTGPNSAGLLEYCWFEGDQPNISYLYDETDYSVWQQAGGVGEWIQVSMIPHNLPFCPVFKMWDDVETFNPLTSNTIIRPLLSMLDRYMFWDAAAESNDLASAFMMLWHLKESQRKDNIFAGPNEAAALIAELPGVVCRPQGTLEDGTPYQSLNNPQGNGSDSDKKTLYGPGSSIPIDAPQTKDDADWRVPAGYIAPPVPNLVYIADKAKGFKHLIRTAATGYEAPTNGQAINETQVMSIVEKSRLIYQYLAPHFETLEHRVLTCLVTLMYGPEVIRDITCSYGTRFSMLTGRELAELLQIVKDAELNLWLVEELNQLQQEYYSRNDPKRRLRFKMLDDLTDYPNTSENQLKALGVDQSDPEGFQLKISLLGFVHRFERENGLTIEEFGSIGVYEDRINQIKLRFKVYGSERKPIERPTESGSGGNPGNGKPATVVD